MRPKPEPDDTETTSTDLKVVVTYEGHPFSQDLAFQSHINTEDIQTLSNEFAENPLRFARWAFLEAQAKSALAEAEAALDHKESELFIRFMESLRERDAKGKMVRPALDLVRARVNIHPERLALERRVRKLRKQCDELAVGRKTIEHRKEALITIGANVRAERDSNIRINEKAKQAKEEWARRQQQPPTRRT